MKLECNFEAAAVLIVVAIAMASTVTIIFTAKSINATIVECYKAQAAASSPAIQECK